MLIVNDFLFIDSLWADHIHWWGFSIWKVDDDIQSGILKPGIFFKVA